jgi:site-specific recombinase XerD
MAQAKHDRPPTVVSVSSRNKEIRAFLVDRQAAGCSPRTIKGYREELGRRAQWLEDHGVRDAPDITPAVLRQFSMDLAEAGHNPGGVHRMCRAAKTFLRWWESETELTVWATTTGAVNTSVSAPTTRRYSSTSWPTRPTPG